ncbi:MAG: thioesterase II family protein [Rhodanobacter sp.]
MTAAKVDGVKNPWFIEHARGTGGKRLFCFPYAGGNAQLFAGWAGKLPDNYDIIGVQSPGKGSRLLEPALPTTKALVAALLPSIEPMLYEGAFSFFGHSNGALTAFELACTLQARGLPLPDQLFLSASPAPWTRKFERPYSAMDDAEFRQLLGDMEGTPAEVLADDELFELVLPGLRADFIHAETYSFTWPHRLAVPVTTIHGDQDSIDEVQIAAWQDQIAFPIRRERISGGHFFIHSHHDELTARIATQLRRGVRRNLPDPATDFA